MRIHHVLGLLPFIGLTIACAVQAPRRASDRVRAQLDDDWKYWMTEYPETATAFGFPGQDARWTDYTSAAIERRAQYLKQSAERLAAIDRAGLDAGDALNYDLY